MSANILEQAIIDAKALREAALKNAETSILEKYSAEVRGAIDVMLEAEMEEGSIMEHEMMTPEEDMESAPLAAAEGEELCGCPDQDEKVEWELSLNDLTAMSEEMDEGAPMAQEDLAEEFGAEPLEEEDEMFLQESEELDEEIDLVFEDDDSKWTYPDPKELDPMDPEEKAGKRRKKDRGTARLSTKSPTTYSSGSQNEDLDEDIELDEEMVREIVEELVSEDVQLEVDTKPNKSGHAGTPEPIVRYQEEQRLAQLQATEAKEENDALLTAAADLSEAKKAVETENEKLKQLIYDLKGKLDESILSNAKLLYTNQTLTSASLNERQKNRIVESIQDADSVEEAKVIFETLQSAAGPSIRKPKSLSEVISRPSLQVSRRRNENKGRESVAKNRFQKLAGIKNNK